MPIWGLTTGGNDKQLKISEEKTIIIIIIYLIRRSSKELSLKYIQYNAKKTTTDSYK